LTLKVPCFSKSLTNRALGSRVPNYKLRIMNSGYAKVGNWYYLMISCQIGFKTKFSKVTVVMEE